MLYDINDHPKQKEVNEALAQVLTDTIRGLNSFDEKYCVGRRSTYLQFLDVLILYYKREGGLTYREIVHEILKVVYFRKIFEKINNKLSKNK